MTERNIILDWTILYTLFSVVISPVTFIIFQSFTSQLLASSKLWCSSSSAALHWLRSCVLVFPIMFCHASGTLISNLVEDPYSAIVDRSFNFLIMISLDCVVPCILVYIFRHILYVILRSSARRFVEKVTKMRFASSYGNVRYAHTFCMTDFLCTLTRSLTIVLENRSKSDHTGDP